MLVWAEIQKMDYKVTNMFGFVLENVIVLKIRPSGMFFQVWEYVTSKRFIILSIRRRVQFHYVIDKYTYTITQPSCLYVFYLFSLYTTSNVINHTKLNMLKLFHNTVDHYERVHELCRVVLQAKVVPSYFFVDMRDLFLKFRHVE